ncbi:MAG: hemerythrin domain-containing protein [Chitinophagales bacterium]
MSNSLQSYLNSIGENSDHLQMVLDRYPLKIENRQEPFSKFLTRNQLTEDFVKNIAVVLESPESFEAENFKSASIPVVLDYLKSTHQYYQSYYFSKIDRSIDNLYQLYSEAEELLDLLKLFFMDYQRDIHLHIAEEEEKLFPYIYKLLCLPSVTFKKRHKKGFSIAQFKKQHNDENENALLQIINMIRQRYPAAGFSPLNILLLQIQLFEKDLRIHSKIEEEVLLPKAEKLEKLVLNNY